MTPDQQRALGAYYTPQDAAEFMAAWALGDGGRILEPSFGDGVFIDAARRVAERLGVEVSFVAVEISPEAFERVRGWSEADRTVLGDFHSVEAVPVDAVLGNPPFVRFRNLPEDQSHLARVAGSKVLGASLEEAGSSWMSIALHSSAFLRPLGRLALVLPADALYVAYARPFWSYMASRFGSLNVLRSRERLFPEILQDVVILLADRYGASTDRINMSVYRTCVDLSSGSPEHSSHVPLDEVLEGSKPFTRALLAGAIEEIHAEAGDLLTRADAYVKFGVGYVDAAKKFFHPDPPTIEHFKLPERSLLPALRSARYWSGCYRTSDLLPSASCVLWRPDPAQLTLDERRYIAYGEEMGYNTGYKTRKRDPWYVVPDVIAPDLVVSVFGSLPKLMVNDANFVVSNSIMRAQWVTQARPEQLLASWYSSLGRLGIEVSVHSLGGGVLVLVPREGDAIMLPRLPESPPKAALLEQLREALLAGDLRAAYATGDDYLVANGWNRDIVMRAGALADELQAWREDR